MTLVVLMHLKARPQTHMLGEADSSANTAVSAWQLGAVDNSAQRVVRVLTKRGVELSRLDASRILRCRAVADGAATPEHACNPLVKLTGGLKGLLAGHSAAQPAPPTLRRSRFEVDCAGASKRQNSRGRAQKWVRTVTSGGYRLV